MLLLLLLLLGLMLLFPLILLSRLAAAAHAGATATVLQPLCRAYHTGMSPNMCLALPFSHPASRSAMRATTSVCGSHTTATPTGCLLRICGLWGTDVRFFIKLFWDLSWHVWSSSQAPALKLCRHWRTNQWLSLAAKLQSSNSTTDFLVRGYGIIQILMIRESKVARQQPGMQQLVMSSCS